MLVTEQITLSNETLNFSIKELLNIYIFDKKFINSRYTLESLIILKSIYNYIEDNYNDNYSFKMNKIYNKIISMKRKYYNIYYYYRFSKKPSIKKQMKVLEFLDSFNIYIFNIMDDETILIKFGFLLFLSNIKIYLNEVIYYSSIRKEKNA